MLPNQEKLDRLNQQWREKHAAKGYQRFISDGAVCPEVWWSQETPRVCFFLKEAYTREEHFDLAEALHRWGPWKMWKKAAVWTQAIHSAFLRPVPFDPELIRPQVILCGNTLGLLKLVLDGELKNETTWAEQFF